MEKSIEQAKQKIVYAHKRDHKLELLGVKRFKTDFKEIETEIINKKREEKNSSVHLYLKTPAKG